MKADTRLQQLGRLTDMVFMAERAKLRDIESREGRLQSLLDDLQKSTQTAAPQGAAALSDTDMRWRKWIYHRRVVINTELAQVRALKEQQITVLRKAFGRDMAARAMKARAEDDARQKFARRADQTS